MGAIMDWIIICYVLAGAAAGGFVNGLAGFGTALMSLGIWLQAMPAEQAVPIVAVMSVISGVQSLWLTRRSLALGRRRLPRFLVPALAGLWLGTLALGVISASTIKLTIAGLMLIYCVFFIFRAHLPRFERDHPVLDSTVGFLSGVLGGAASLSGVLPTMYCAIQPWSKLEVSAILRPFNVTVLAIAAAAYAIKGFINTETLWMIALALPTTILATQTGIALFKRLSDAAFRRLLVALMFISAVSLIIRELF